MNTLGIVDWNGIATATTAISGAVQTGANAYTSINNSINANKSSNPTVQQYLNPQPPSQTPLTPKDNTILYVAIGGLGILAVGGAIIFAVTRKKRG